MFGLSIRVKKLEERLDAIERKEKCAQGRHVWEICENHGDPFMRCQFCYARPKDKP